MAAIKLIVLMFTILALTNLGNAKRTQKRIGYHGVMRDGGSGVNYCENRSEFNECKDACYDDGDCNDEAQLNCGSKCKVACERIEKIGRCKAAMLYEILDGRGRLD